MSAVLVETLSSGHCVSFRDLCRVKNMPDASILEISGPNPFFKMSEACDWLNYVSMERSEAFIESKMNILSENMLDLYKDKSFDMILAGDVLDIMPDDVKFLGALYKILNPGGAVLVTVPFKWPVQDVTLHRSQKIKGRLKNHLDQKFKTKNGLPTLVYREYGLDLLDMAHSLGFESRITRPSMMSRPGYFDSVFIFSKPEHDLV
jgi:SAM-dependent methyltransferase